MSNYIRFDWAMKRLLRDKANFAVLEGFMTTLLGEKIPLEQWSYFLNTTWLSCVTISLPQGKKEGWRDVKKAARKGTRKERKKNPCPSPGK